MQGNSRVASFLGSCHLNLPLLTIVVYCSQRAAVRSLFEALSRSFFLALRGSNFFCWLNPCVDGTHVHPYMFEEEIMDIVTYNILTLNHILSTLPPVFGWLCNSIYLANALMLNILCFPVFIIAFFHG